MTIATRATSIWTWSSKQSRHATMRKHWRTCQYLASPTKWRSTCRLNQKQRKENRRKYQLLITDFGRKISSHHQVLSQVSSSAGEVTLFRSVDHRFMISNGKRVNGKKMKPLIWLMITLRMKGHCQQTKLGKRTSTKKKEVKITSGTIKVSNLISTSLVSKELIRTPNRLPHINLLCNRHPKCLKDPSKTRKLRMKSHGINRCYKVKRYKMRQSLKK